jgi:hypothetical protein
VKFDLMDIIAMDINQIGSCHGYGCFIPPFIATRISRVLALVLRNDVLPSFYGDGFEFNALPPISRTYCGILEYWKYKSGALCLVEAQVQVPKKSEVVVAQSDVPNFYCVYCIPVRYQRKFSEFLRKTYSRFFASFVE